jgi:hypothetical protein
LHRLGVLALIRFLPAILACIGIGLAFASFSRYACLQCLLECLFLSAVLVWCLMTREPEFFVYSLLLPAGRIAPLFYA